MRLVFVTQSVDSDDPILGATVAKLRALALRCDELVVIRNGNAIFSGDIAGFSDGASVALAWGLMNGDLFPNIAAFSPGFIQLSGPATGSPVTTQRCSSDAATRPQARTRSPSTSTRSTVGRPLWVKPVPSTARDWRGSSAARCTAGGWWSRAPGPRRAGWPPLCAVSAPT